MGKEKNLNKTKISTEISQGSKGKADTCPVFRKGILYFSQWQDKDNWERMQRGRASVGRLAFISFLWLPVLSQVELNDFEKHLHLID